MEIDFGGMEPPKIAFQWLQRVQSPQCGPILSPFEAFRGPKRCFRGAFGLKIQNCSSKNDKLQ